MALLSAGRLDSVACSDRISFHWVSSSEGDLHISPTWLDSRPADVASCLLRTPQQRQDSDDISTCCTPSDLGYPVLIVLLCLILLTPNPNGTSRLLRAPQQRQDSDDISTCCAPLDLGYLAFIILLCVTLLTLTTSQQSLSCSRVSELRWHVIAMAWITCHTCIDLYCFRQMCTPVTKNVRFNAMCTMLEDAMCIPYTGSNI